VIHLQPKDKTYHFFQISFACLFFMLIISLSLMSVFGNLDDRSIYGAKTATISQSTTGGAILNSKTGAQVEWISANLSFIPISDYRQDIISQEIYPLISKKGESWYFFEWRNPGAEIAYELNYVVQTTSEPLKVTKQVTYPYNRNQLTQYQMRYLDETDLIDITPSIKDKAKELAQNSTDVYEIAFNVANWVSQNIEYDLNTLTADASQKASWVFETRSGVCDELSTLYIAMMRSLGIPTRFVSGIAYTNSELFDQPWNPHAWTEVYMGEFGWVPVDLTYGQFGYLDASHIKSKVSVDADESQTKYSWSSRRLSDVSVELIPLHFSQTILSLGDKREAPYTLDAKIMHNKIGFGSYSGIILTATNTQTHYVADQILIGSSQGITLSNERLPLLLRPLETKKFLVLFSVDSNLDTRYSYTMPISVQNEYGDTHILAVESMAEFQIIAQKQIEDDFRIIEKLNFEQSLQFLDVGCTQDSLFIIAEAATITCVVTQNVPNSELDYVIKSMQLCFDDDCQLTDFKTNATFTFALIPTRIGTHTVLVELTILDLVQLTSASSSSSRQSPNVQLRKQAIHTYEVVDYAKYELTNVAYTQNVSYPDDAVLNFTIDKQSISRSNSMYISIGKTDKTGVDLASAKYVWELGELNADQNMNIRYDSDNLVPGENNLVILLSYETGKNIEVQAIPITIHLADVGLIRGLYLRLINLFK
jgi:transglutaminase-like putative cysteine protease